MWVETIWCAASGGCGLAMHILLLQRAMEVMNAVGADSGRDNTCSSVLAAGRRCKSWSCLMLHSHVHYYMQ
jgi:hypothetical protein